MKKAEGRRQKAEGRRQKAEGRRQRRIVCLDFVKGVTIFLVVFGHCIQYGNGKEFLKSCAFFDDILFRIIYSFHMPLFAIVSGYLFFFSVSSRNPREVIIRQANNLILPMLSWTVLIGIMKAAFHVYSGNYVGISSELFSILRSFLYSFWFLWAMFMASIVVILAREKFHDSMKFYALILVLLLFMPGKIIPAVHVFVYPYFIAGYIWHREGMNEKFDSNIFLYTGVIIVWCLMMMFYDRNSYVYTTGTALVKYRQKIFMPSQILTDIFRWLIGFAGCGTVLVILLKLIKPVNFIAELGTKSLGIYIMSSYVLHYLPESGGYIINFLEAVIITFTCYWLYVMITRIKILNKLLFGGR